MKLFKFDKSLYRFESEDEVLTLGSLFVPFFIEMVLRNMLGTVNTITLGHYSDDAVAAVGTASQLVGMILTFYSVVSTGASIVISQELGARHRKDAGNAAVATLLLSTATSLAAGLILGALAQPCMALMQLTGSTLTSAAAYFRIVIYFSFLSAIMSGLGSVLRSYGRPKAPVAVALLMNFINVILNIVIVYRPFETPLHGVSGVAVANVISEGVAVCLLIVLFRLNRLDIHFNWQSVVRSLRIGKQIMTIGIPGGVVNLSYSLSQVVSTSIIAVLGVAAISTKVYLSNIFFYIYVLGLALGEATSLMVGRLVGAGSFEKAYRLNLQNLKITIACNAFASMLIIVFGENIMHLFTANEEIISMAKVIIWIDFFVEIGRGFNHIEANSLSGAGDVFFQMIISVVSCWVMSIGFSYIFGITLGWGLIGCWIAFAMDEAFRGSVFFYRWHSRKWTQKAVAKTDQPPHDRPSSYCHCPSESRT